MAGRRLLWYQRRSIAPIEHINDWLSSSWMCLLGFLVWKSHIYSKGGGALFHFTAVSIAHGGTSNPFNSVRNSASILQNSTSRSSCRSFGLSAGCWVLQADIIEQKDCSASLINLQCIVIHYAQSKAWLCRETRHFAPSPKSSESVELRRDPVMAQHAPQLSNGVF